jgi:hypothetical protein
VLQNLPFSETIGLRLSAAELDDYTQRSWSGPFPLLDAAGVSLLTAAYTRSVGHFMLPPMISPGLGAGAFQKKPWFKSAHAFLPEFYDVATHPAIVNRIRSILGEDVLLWGSGAILKTPGQLHQWHVDVEHRDWDGVSVFLGLQGTTKDTSLRILEGSHGFAKTPRELGIDSDDKAVAAARENGSGGVIADVDMGEGEFFIFAGRAWHGSLNRGSAPRLALILQYARPDAKIRIPLNLKDPIQWHNFSPPCVLAAGVDKYHVNKLVSRPQMTTWLP